MKTWCPITTRPLSWQRSLKTSILIMYHVSKCTCRCTSLTVASLLLPARATERVFVYSRDLFCCKFALEDSRTPRRNLKIKEVLETSKSLELKDWRFLYIDFILYGILPDDPKEAVAIRRKNSRFYYNAIMQTLYRRSYDGILLRCLPHKEVQKALKEAHDGMCRAHQPGPKFEY